MKRFLFFAAFSLLLFKGFSQSVAYLNPDLPFEQRVDSLVAQMTLDEKISQMMDVAPAIERLGIPAYNWWNEGLHGVARAGYATVFPQAIGLAAMWDDSLHYQIAQTIATEFRAKYNDAIKQNDRSRYKGLTVWSPNVNIFRDPRWGRGQETYGEDPYLSARYGVAFIKGLQGNNSKFYATIATPKHYAVHSGPEKLRHEFDIDVTQHDFLETYIPAFEACIKEGKAYSLMSAYNRFRGKSCTGSDDLLNDLLRKKWGFEGFVVSDCDAVDDIFRTHKIVKTPEEAAAVSLKSGCDLNCGDCFSNLKVAVQKGLVTEADIDVSLKRLMLARMKLGMFEPKGSVPYDTITMYSNDSKANRVLALNAAQQSIVMLKNNGVLPINRKTLKKIAILGPNSEAIRTMYGNYNGIPSKVVTPLEGLKTALLPKNQIYANQMNGLVTEALSGKPINAANLSFEGKPGLKAEIFNNINFEGSPILTKIDTAVDYEWDSEFPAKGVSATNISIRWTGELTASETAEYYISFTGDDGYRVWIDNKLFLEEWKRQSPYTLTKAIKLNKGEKHAFKIEYFQGGGGAVASLKWSYLDKALADKVIAEAEKSDVIVYFGGLSPELEGEEMNVPYPGFDRGDRTSIEMPEVQRKMLKLLKKTGKPVVLVLMSGSAIGLDWENENLDAIIQAWYPGEEGGTAIADVLLGNFNPGGRLPVTFYQSTEQLPPFVDYNMKNRTYRYFTGKPLFPFGYGLSYTKFTYSALKVPSQVKSNEGIKVQVTVLNSGTKEGDEVIQLYVKHPNVTVPVPLYSLKGFKKVHLKASERTNVTFNLTSKDLAILDKDNKWFVHYGDIEIYIGGSLPNKDLLKEKKILMGTVSMSGDDFYLP
jgi:beta-glucosidase